MREEDDYYRPNSTRDRGNYDHDRGNRDGERVYERNYGGGRGGADRSRGGRNFEHRERRSPGRSDSRERKRSRFDDNDRRDNRDNGRHYGPAAGRSETEPRSLPEPVPTVILKGLPAHTSESTLQAVMAAYYPKSIRLITQRDGDCKGFAFVELPSVEYSQHLMAAYAGSAGDPNAPQLIIENRAVTLEYARDNRSSSSHSGSSGGSGGGGDRRGPVKTDWLCDKCNCHNFSRRDACFRCSTPRSEHCVSVPSGSAAVGGHSAEAHLDAATDVPSTFIVVKGLSPLVVDDQIKELYRQYAIIKSVSLMRDPATNYSRGVAFVEFHSIEYAAYAVQCTNGMSFGPADMAVGGDNILHVSFAKIDIMQKLLKKSLQPGNALAVNPLVAAALQAAQWSANNGYSTASIPMNSTAATASNPAVVPSSQHQLSSSVLSTAYNNNSSSSTPYPSLPPGTEAYHPYTNNLPTTATSTTTQYYNPDSANPFPPLLMRWPPNFDTNGGAYVFQSKTGFFLEPSSEFYYDPKNKRYFCGKNGMYYTYDVGFDPPFRIFHPPAPTTTSDSTVQQGGTSTGCSATGTGTGSSATENTATKQSSTTSSTSNSSSAKVKVGMSLGKTIATAGTVGFGFGSTGMKKAKLDIAKWGALQDDEDDVVEEKGKAGMTQKGLDARINEIKKKVVSSQGDGCSSLTQQEGQREREQLHTDIAVGVVPPPLPPSQLPAPPSATSTVAAAATATLLSASHSLLPTPSPPPPPPPPSTTTSNTVTATIAAATATKSPICLLCQRQFQSFDMLQRHERESKLHAENLRKLQQQ